jgi:type I restriction enzyme S subunit
MSFPRYPTYKPSGVEWLGEVPEHWETLRLRFAVTLNPSKQEAKELGEQEVVSFLPMEAIGEDGSLRLENEREVAECLSGYTYFRDGDVCVAKITPCFENGKGAILRELKGGIGFGTTELIVARPQKERITSEFLDYLFRSQTFRRLGESEMYGAGGQKRVPDSFVRDFTAALPSIEEQNQATTFLDHETAKIDALISEQQRLIELLQEKRQAVISHAVTKGLNPDAPMKDSGVEWLGEVPEHWDVTPLKYLSEIKAGFAFKSDEFTDSGVPVLRIGDIGRDGTVDFCDAKYLAAEALDDHSDVLVKHGDIVMAMTGATIGKAARYTAAEPALLNQRVCIFRARHPESQPYVWFALATHYYAEYLTITAFGGAQPNISDSELVACHVPIPPVKERVDIAMRLSEDMANMVVLETEAQQAISLLQERRSALISAAVTGQIDVRGLVPEAVAA